MSYQSIATKYRPRTFQDMVGQDSVTIALGNAIKLGREPHGVVFSGVRGVGKTTTARLYAKALNCENGPTDHPCNVCDSCKLINEGRHEDVLEIDGASNTGVDDIRQLQETINYSPQRSQFKVYIIDEVHMLSQSAFNALLKTLEEPPSHVVFVFATTELHKVPDTIQSRCQVYHLQKLNVPTIVDRIKTILEIEKVDYEEKALHIVAREGHGSMRDALTFLDQAITMGEGGITVESLRELTKNVSSLPYMEFLEAYIKRDAAYIVAKLQEWDNQGIQFYEGLEEVLKFCRHCFIVKDLGPDSLDMAYLGLDSAELDKLKEIASMGEAFDLNRIFRTIDKCRRELDGSGVDRYIIENFAFEWCFDPGLPKVEDLMGGNIRVEQARTQITGGSASYSSPSMSPETRDSQQAPKSSTNLMSKFKSTVQSPSDSEIKKESKPVEQTQQIVVDEPVKKEESSDSLKSKWSRKSSEPVAETSFDDLAAEISAPSNESALEIEEQVQSFPDNWRACVQLIMDKQPLFARILEEAALVSYSPEYICIEFLTGSMALSRISQADFRETLNELLKDVCAFEGRFEYKEREELESERVLDTKNREKQEKRKQLLAELENHIITKSAVSIFNGKIEGMKLNDDD